MTHFNIYTVNTVRCIIHFGLADCFSSMFTLKLQCIGIIFLDVSPFCTQVNLIAFICRCLNKSVAFTHISNAPKQLILSPLFSLLQPF